MPQFSVIMPLYNKAHYVRKAVESVVGQTYHDWELVVIDDCSTDGSGDVVTRFSDSRIRLVRLVKNAGVGTARNRGVAESTAQLLCFLDADDWWEPTFLEDMVGLVERYPGAGIFGTGYYIVKNGKKRVAPIGVDDSFVEGEINYCQVYSKTLCMPLTSISVCIPRPVFDEAGGFPTNVRLGEDFLLWLRIALSHQTVLLNKPLSNYNQDVDVKYRGTHHLHEPRHHMLWNLNDFERLEQANADYKQLIDNLRTYSLQNYLLDSRYCNDARQELAKVDWSRQPVSTRRLYCMPLWLLRLRHAYFKLGSSVKQKLIKRNGTIFI